MRGVQTVNKEGQHGGSPRVLSPGCSTPLAPKPHLLLCDTMSAGETAAESPAPSPLPSCLIRPWEALPACASPVRQRTGLLPPGTWKSTTPPPCCVALAGTHKGSHGCTQPSASPCSQGKNSSWVQPLWAGRVWSALPGSPCTSHSLCPACRPFSRGPSCPSPRLNTAPGEKLSHLLGSAQHPLSASNVSP